MPEEIFEVTPPVNEESTVCLNLGCGSSIRKSTAREKWLNLDQFDNEGVDIIHDLEETPLPLEDDSVDHILASHVFEHIHNLKPLLQECHRVLKPKGTLAVRVPEGSCRAAYADPTHVRFFAPETFYHFSESKIGFDTFGLRNLFKIQWLEVNRTSRKGIDGGVTGSYFTEIICDLEKSGEPYSWEIPKDADNNKGGL